MSQLQQPTTLVAVSVVLHNFIPHYIHFGLLIELHIYINTLWGFNALWTFVCTCDRMREIYLSFFLNPEKVSFILSESNQDNTIQICIPCHHWWVQTDYLFSRFIITLRLIRLVLIFYVWCHLSSDLRWPVLHLASWKLPHSADCGLLWKKWHT